MKKLCLAMLCLACSAAAPAWAGNTTVQDSRYDFIVSVSVPAGTDADRWGNGIGPGKFNLLVCNESVAVAGQATANLGSPAGTNFAIAKDSCMPVTGATGLQLKHVGTPWTAKVYIKWQ